MSADPIRLCIFDVDGTLVDSRATIIACVQAAFVAAGLVVPAPEAIRRIVGLSLVEAMTVLMGYEDPRLAARVAAHYREAFLVLRHQPDFAEPLFPGAAQMLAALLERGLVLGIATGKAMRGVLDLLNRHGLERYFTTLQTADLHPSKPDPSMVRAALTETGVAPSSTVLVGDTSYDILMALAAGVRPIGVAWGNHPAAELKMAGAEQVLATWDDLTDLIAAGLVRSEGC